MLPEFFKKRRTYFLITISLGILIILGVSYGYFTRESLIGNSSNNTINVSTISQTSQSFVTTYENASNKIITGILNFEGTTPYTKMAKFKTENIYNDSLDITINWSFVTSTLIQSDTSYALYECSTEALFNNATESNVASTCTLVSPSTGNVLPNTGEAYKLQSADDITLAANGTKYYVANISIGSSNEGRNFQAIIDVKDRFTHVLTIDYNGGGTTTTMDMKAGDSVTLSSPTRTGYTFNGWAMTVGLDSSVVGSTITMGSTDTTVQAGWTPITYTVSYNCNGNVGGATDQTNHIYDVPKKLSANGCHKITTGVSGSVYIFTGWAKSETGNVEFLDEEEIVGITSLSQITLYAKWQQVFTYSGSKKVFYESGQNWKVKLYSSGTFTSLINNEIDVFLVGGGGGGSITSVQSYSAGSGGSGETESHFNESVLKEIDYPITIGAGGARNTDGGSTTGFDYVAKGGKAGKFSGSRCCALGGSGGSAGGNDCVSSANNGGSVTICGTVISGQGNTTGEFGIPTNTLYSAGGAYPGYCGGNNTGNGGGGVNTGWHTDNCGGIGGSGIVIVRNHR